MDGFVRYENQTRNQTAKVFFLGTGALIEGQGLCYDRDYDDSTAAGDATVAWAQRCIYVNAPSATNNNSFAGVVVRPYAANSAGQWVEIYLPGSVCRIYVADASATIGERSFVACLAGSSVDAGQFSAVTTSIVGKGVARVMQTLAAEGLCLAELMDGPESGCLEIIKTATLTAGGAATLMVGGVTYFEGPATPGTDVTATLADGTYIGQIKRFYQGGALTSNDVVITVTSGVQLDGSSGLSTMTFDGDGHDSTLMWTGTTWRLIGNTGTALA